MDFNDYHNKLSYPQRDNFKTTYYYKGGAVIATVRPGDKTVPPIPEGAVRETVVDEVAFKTARAEYGKHEGRLLEMFKVDLLQDFGLPDDDFTRRLIAIAYEQGHSNGLAEVYHCFSNMQDLVDLAKKIYAE